MKSMLFKVGHSQKFKSLWVLPLVLLFLGFAPSLRAQYLPPASAVAKLKGEIASTQAILDAQVSPKPTTNEVRVAYFKIQYYKGIVSMLSQPNMSTARALEKAKVALTKKRAMNVSYQPLSPAEANVVINQTQTFLQN